MKNQSGSWWLKSETDKRWNASGTTSSCDGFTMPEECKQALKIKKLELNEEPPADLEYGYMKD